MNIFSNECEKCGAQVKKRARFCSSCGQPGPKAWVKCAACNKWIGAESEFCPHCKKAQHVGERNLVSNNQITREAGVFIQRIDVDDIRTHVKDFLIIEHGTCVVFMENGKIKNLLEQGKHSINDGFLKSIFTIGTKSFKSFFVIESGDIALPFEGVGLHSQEDMKLDLYTEAVFRFDKENGANLIANLLKDRRQLKYDELGELLNVEVLDSIKSLTNVTSIDTLIKDSNVRLAFENKLSDKLREILKSIGIKLHRIASIDFFGEDYDKLRDIAGDIELKARETALNQRLKELMVSEQMNYIKSEFDLKMYEEQLIHEYNVNKEILSYERQEIINGLKEKLLLKQNEFNRSENMKGHGHNLELNAQSVDTELNEAKKILEEQSNSYDISSLISPFGLKNSISHEAFKSELISSESGIPEQQTSKPIDDDATVATPENITQDNAQTSDESVGAKESCCGKNTAQNNIINFIMASIIIAFVVLVVSDYNKKDESDPLTQGIPAKETADKAQLEAPLIPKPVTIAEINTELQDTEDELEKLKQSYSNLNTLRSAQLEEAVKNQEASNTTMKDIERRLAVAKAELETRDSDKDGILDKVEKRLKLDPNNPNDALQDTDKDGFSNKAEILGAEGQTIFSRATDHTDPLDHPELAHRLKIIPPKDSAYLIKIKEIVLAQQGTSEQTATIEYQEKDGYKTLTGKVRDSFEVNGKTYTIINIQPRKKMIFNKSLWKEVEVTVGELQLKCGVKTRVLYKGEKVLNQQKAQPMVKDSFTGKTYTLSSGSQISIGDSRTGIEVYKVISINDNYVELVDSKTDKSFIIK